jgi:hypothetical protein
MQNTQLGKQLTRKSRAKSLFNGGAIRHPFMYYVSVP